MPIDVEVLHNLPLDDKLHLVEPLWDDIGESAQAAGLHEWHKDEAAWRMAALDSTINEDELWKLVERRDG